MSMLEYIFSEFSLDITCLQASLSSNAQYTKTDVKALSNVSFEVISDWMTYTISSAVFPYTMHIFSY